LNTGTVLQAFNLLIHSILSSGQPPYQIRPILILLSSLEMRKQGGLAIYPGLHSQEAVELGLEPRQLGSGAHVAACEALLPPRAGQVADSRTADGGTSLPSPKSEPRLPAEIGLQSQFPGVRRTHKPPGVSSFFSATNKNGSVTGFLVGSTEVRRVKVPLIIISSRHTFCLLNFWARPLLPDPQTPPAHPPHT